MRSEIKEKILKILKHIINPPLTELPDEDYDVAYAALSELGEYLLEGEVTLMTNWQLSQIHYYLAELAKELKIGMEEVHYEKSYQYMKKGGANISKKEYFERYEEFLSKTNDVTAESIQLHSCL